MKQQEIMTLKSMVSPRGRLEIKYKPGEHAGDE
jgi:hypothetical protein